MDILIKQAIHNAASKRRQAKLIKLAQLDLSGIPELAMQYARGDSHSSNLAQGYPENRMGTAPYGTESIGNNTRAGIPAYNNPWLSKLIGEPLTQFGGGIASMLSGGRITPTGAGNKYDRAWGAINLPHQLRTNKLGLNAMSDVFRNSMNKMVDWNHLARSNPMFSNEAFRANYLNNSVIPGFLSQIGGMIPGRGLFQTMGRMGNMFSGMGNMFLNRGPHAWSKPQTNKLMDLRNNK